MDFTEQNKMLAEHNKVMEALKKKTDDNLRAMFVEPTANPPKPVCTTAAPLKGWVPEVGKKARVVPRVPPDYKEPPNWISSMDDCCGKVGDVVSVKKTTATVQFAPCITFEFKFSWLLPE